VNYFDLQRGKLFSLAASLALVFSRALLRWQNPVHAASESLSALVVSYGRILCRDAERTSIL
jgi:hypothetical protein